MTLAAVVLAGLTLGGCLPTAKAHVSVADLEATFPALERMHVEIYIVEPRTDQPDCVVFSYSHGAFTSDPSDEFCQDHHRAPTAFDPQANDDLAALKAEFAKVGVPIDYLSINLDQSGAVGPDSAFSADRCVSYFYTPGWTTLPEHDRNSVSTGIDADWTKRDDCP